MFIKMTLNSVDWYEKLIMRTGSNVLVEEIGSFIDTLMFTCNDKTQHLENDTSYLDVSNLDFRISSVDEEGKVLWKKVTAVTKHPPINKDGTNTLIKVETRMGRTVVATKAKSFLKRIDNKVTAVNGSDLLVGDHIPINLKMKVEDVLYKVPMDMYLSKYEFVFGDDMHKAMNLRSEGVKRWWMENGKSFTLPYTRGECAVGAFYGNKQGEVRSDYVQRFKKGYVYTRTNVRTDIKIPDHMHLDRDFGFFIGAYLAEGMSNETQIIISNKDDKYRKKITDLCDKWEAGYHIVNTTHPEHSNWTGVDIRIHSTVLAKLFGTMCGKTSPVKKVPNWAYIANDECIKGILDGYFSGDGTVSKKSKTILATSVSEELIYGIIQLLTRFGILAKKASYKARLTNNVGSQNILPTHHITISNEGVVIFAREIGLVIEKKNEKIIEYAKRETRFTRSKYDVIPGVETACLSGTYHRDELTRTLEAGLNNKDAEILAKAISADVFYDEIVDITEVPSSKPYVYDLTVQDTLTFAVFSGIQMEDTFHHIGMSEKNVQLGVCFKKCFPLLTASFRCRELKNWSMLRKRFEHHR